MSKSVSVSLWLNAYTNKKGLNLLEIKVVISGHPPTFHSTGYHVEPQQWDKETQNVIDHPNADLLNLTLKREVLDLQSYALRILERRKGNIVPSHITDYFEYGDSNNFIAFYEAQLEVQKKRLITTYKHEKVTFGYLKECVQILPFNALNTDFLDTWNNFLYGKGLKVSSVHGHHKRLKKYINLAIRKDMMYESDNPYKKYKVVRPTQIQRTVLTQKEVAKIANYEPPTPKAALVRDVFLFSCYTGLRNGDVLKMTAADLQEDNNGMILSMTASKTRKAIMLPLYLLFGGKSVGLIQPYLDALTPQTRKKPIFAGLTQLTVNQILKQIAEDLGIRKYLTSHVARHTFSTFMADKVPPLVLKDMLQHSDMNTTLIYVHLSNAHINTAIEKVKWE